MIEYRVGDLTDEALAGRRVIAHVCNDRGGWGKGFVLSLSARWPQVERAYRELFRAGDARLGVVQFVNVTEEVTIANMVTQEGYRKGTSVPLRYDWVGPCLGAVGHHARLEGASVHMPRIGCGLAGGRWELIEPIILKELHDLHVVVYDLPLI